LLWNNQKLLRASRINSRASVEGLLVSEAAMSRREFIALLPASAFAAQSRRLTADEVLKDLMAGNERF
jgi:hypothetical protein